MLLHLTRIRNRMKNRNQIDEAKAIANLAGDRKLLIELAQILSEDLPPLMQRLRSAMDQENRVLTRSLIHKLRNLAATFFATEIGVLANQIELDCARGDYDLLMKNVRRLSEMLQNLLAEVYDRGWSDHLGDFNLPGQG